MRDIRALSRPHVIFQLNTLVLPTTSTRHLRNVPHLSTCERGGSGWCRWWVNRRLSVEHGEAPVRHQIVAVVVMVVVAFGGRSLTVIVPGLETHMRLEPWWCGPCGIVVVIGGGDGDIGGLVHPGFGAGGMK